MGEEGAGPPKTRELVTADAVAPNVVADAQASPDPVRDAVRLAGLSHPRSVGEQLAERHQPVRRDSGLGVEVGFDGTVGAREPSETISTTSSNRVDGVAHGVGFGDAAIYHGDVGGGRSPAEDFDVGRFEDLDIGTAAVRCLLEEVGQHSGGALMGSWAPDAAPIRRPSRSVLTFRHWPSG